MSNINFLKGNEANLPKIKDKDSFYITEDSGKIILGDNTWDSKNNVPLNFSLISSENSSNYFLSNNLGNELFSYPKIKYEVKYNLVGCSVNNQINEIGFNESMSIDIIPDFTNSTLTRCEVFVGGINYTKETVNLSTKKINISNIKGNVYLYIIIEEKNKNDYIKVENFIKDSGNGITLSQEGDYVVAKIENGNSFFWVTSSSYFPQAKKCELQVDDAKYFEIDGVTPLKATDLKFYGFAKKSILGFSEYALHSNFYPSTDYQGSNGMVSFGAGIGYFLFNNYKMVLKFKAKLLFS